LRTGAVLPPPSFILATVLALLLASCAHSGPASDPGGLDLEVKLPIDTRPQDVLASAWEQIQAGKIFSAEANLSAYLKNDPNHLEITTLLAYLLDEGEDELAAQAAWADLEALLVYKGKLQPFQLQVTLYAGARRYLRLHKPSRARLFHDELWRRHPASVWSQLTYLEVAEAAADRGRWVQVHRVCQDLMRMGAEDRSMKRCKVLTKVSASMRAMGPEPHRGAPRWTWLHPVPQGNHLNDVWTGTDGEVIAVGDKGTILHRPAGSTAFAIMTSGTRWNLRAIHGTSRAHLYAVGDGAIVLGFDGKTWKVLRPADPVRANLTAVYSGGAGHMVATSMDGEFLTLDGGKWVEAKPGNQPLYGVWGEGKAKLQAVGKGGLLMRYEGGSWTTMASDTYEDLHGIWGKGVERFVAVGANRTVVYYNGKRTKEAVAGLTGFADIWGAGDGNLWAVGRKGNIIHRKPKTRTWSNRRSGVRVDLNGVSGYQAGSLVAVGQGGTLVQRNGKGAWDVLVPGSNARLVGVAPDPALGERGLITLGKFGMLLVHDDQGWKTVKALPRGKYHDLCSAGSTVAAVGDRGLMVVREDGKWRRVRTGTSEDLHDVDGCAAGQLVAVGTRGVAVSYKDGKAKVHKTPTGHTLYGVWVGAPNDVWAVGGRGVTLHFDGKRWQEFDTGQLQALRAVDMAGRQLMAVGEGGLVLYLDHGRWRPFQSPTAQTLVAIWGGPKGRVVAASQEGGIIEHDGQKWVIHNSDAPCITSLAEHPALGLLAVGCNRSVLTLPRKK